MDEKLRILGMFWENKYNKIPTKLKKKQIYLFSYKLYKFNEKIPHSSNSSKKGILIPQYINDWGISMRLKKNKTNLKKIYLISLFKKIIVE